MPRRPPRPTGLLAGLLVSLRPHAVPLLVLAAILVAAGRVELLGLQWLVWWVRTAVEGG